MCANISHSYEYGYTAGKLAADWLNTNCSASQTVACALLTKPQSLAVIDRANGWILQIAEATGTHYTDSASVLKGADGKLVSDYGNGDGIHLSAVGFNRVIDYLKTHAWL